MTMNGKVSGHERRWQAGVSIVEFALVIVVFFTLLLGILEFGRLMFVWNSLVEVTRMGARVAVVCDMDDADIKAKMIAFPSLATLTTSNITINYLNPPNAANTCSKANCKAVEVKITGVNFNPVTSWFNLNIPLPAAVTTLPRESMESVNASGETNPVCI
jgi:Flp pilus assembly protein TadG